MKKKGLVLVFTSTLIVALGQFLLKIGTESSFSSLYSIITNIPLLLGAFVYFIGSILFILSLNYSDLSIIYPVFALTFVWITLISYFILYEPLTLYKSMGILLIISGVSILGVKDD